MSDTTLALLMPYTIDGIPASTFTANGSFLAGTGAGTFEEVTGGTTGQVPTKQADGSLAFQTPSGSGTSDHGALTGLGDDDHTQYHTDGRADTWLGTKDSDDIAEGATNLWLTGAERAAISTIVTDHGALTGLGDDDHTQYHTDARALTWLGTRTTTDLPEGSNLYWTTGRGDTWLATKNAADVGALALSLAVAAGDVLYATGSGVWARLAKGTDGQVLTLASGLPSWAAAGGGGGTPSAPARYVYAGSDIDLAPGPATVDVDTTYRADADFSISSGVLVADNDATRWVVFEGCAVAASSGTGNPHIDVWIEHSDDAGSTWSEVAHSRRHVEPVKSGPAYISCRARVAMAATDQLRIRAERVDGNVTGRFVAGDYSVLLSEVS